MNDFSTVGNVHDCVPNVLCNWRLWAAFVTVKFSVGFIVNTLYNVSLSVKL